MIFPSREQFIDGDDFVEQFLETIDSEITSHNYRNSKLQASTDFVTVGQLRHMTSDTFFSKTSSSNYAFDIIDLGFRLLGYEDWSWDFHQTASIDILKRLVKVNDKSIIKLLCNTLIDLDLFKVIEEHNAEDILLGIYLAKYTPIGNEKMLYHQLTQKIEVFIENLFSDTNIKIHRNINVYDRNFEFGLILQGKLRFVIDIDYYLVSGSKPTLISKEYGFLQYQLSFENIGLVWITDGSGYFDMKNSLKYAYKILPNIYNLYQLKKYFQDDIKPYLRV